MPVSFSTAKHSAESFAPSPGPYSPEELFARACPEQSDSTKGIIQSSFGAGADGKVADIIPKGNGFIDTIAEAYNRHRALVIRPDDVWITILTQFSLYVNGSAEQLRSKFVKHEGKKELEVKDIGTQQSVDFGRMAKAMTDVIQENVIDASLREWILPNFTTTTPNDTVIASITMMASMKEYFSYKFSLMCGIPHVTLDGEKGDWENILARLDKLRDYGEKTTAWYRLLFPVLSRFVKAFDDPTHPENIAFWQKIYHFESDGSGPEYLSGWATAFCVFNEKGGWIGEPLDRTDSPESDPFTSGQSEQYLILDGVRYHELSTIDVPSCHVAVDVLLDDNGVEKNTVMVAGLVGLRISSSGNQKVSDSGEKDTVGPVSGWWMYLKG